MTTLLKTIETENERIFIIKEGNEYIVRCEAGFMEYDYTFDNLDDAFDKADGIADYLNQ